MKRLRAGIVVLALVVASSAHAGPPSATIADFTLTDDRGEPWSWRQVRGRLALVSFGYTACPDICPMTLNVVSAVLRQLGEKARLVQPVFISVDAEHDTPEVLREYVAYFDPRIVGLTGSPEDIAAVAHGFGVTHKVGAAGEGGRYAVDHSADLFVVDAGGNLIARVPFGFPAEHVVRLLETRIGELERGS